LKTCLFTTETTHHAYFTRRLLERFPATEAICELSQKSGPQKICGFEKQRDSWEADAWFQGKPSLISSMVPTLQVRSINDRMVLEHLEANRPDVVVVFGTGVLEAAVLAKGPKHILNLHGGDPEEYRGLDSHLWAIYEKRFSGLVSTLHRVDPGIDTGEIVEQMNLPCKKNMQLFQLRSLNTEACVGMAINALRKISSCGDVSSFPQRRKGRYLSAMPQEIKEKCPAIFSEYTAGIPG